MGRMNEADGAGKPEAGDERRTWQHEPGDRYALIVRSIVGNERDGFETESVAFVPVLHSLDLAKRRGLRELDRSDDFNIGVLRDGQLVALLWMDEVVDDDPAELAGIAEDAGL